MVALTVLAISHIPMRAQTTAPIDQQQVAALRQMIATVNAGDAAGYARLYAGDAVITIFGGESVNGRSAIEQYEAALMREFPGTRLAFYSVWQVASRAVVHYGVNGQTPDGRAMGHEGVLFLRFDSSGAIVEERRYLDSLTPMAQLGAFGKGAARSLPVLPADLTVAVARDSAIERRHIALVRAALAAIAAKSADAFLSRTALSIAIDELMLPESFVGRGHAVRWFETWNGAVRDPQLEVTRIVGAGDYVLAEAVFRGILSGPIGRLTKAAKPFAVHRAFIVHMKAGAIDRIASFMNGKELAEATGQWPIRP